MDNQGNLDNQIQQQPIDTIPVNPRPIEYAGFVSRAIALMLDFLIFVPVVIFIIFFRAFIYRASPTVQTGYLLLIIPCLLPLYHIILLKRYGTTLGKRLMRLKVVSQTGNQLALGQIILRETVGKIVSTSLFDLGYLWVLFDPKKQSWHDKISNTYVIKDFSILSLKKYIFQYIGIFVAYGLLVILSFSFFVYSVYKNQSPCGRQPEEYTSFGEAFKKPQKVCILRIYSQHIAQLPPNIDKLSKVRYLSLSNTDITALPPEIGRLKKLISLSLFHNQLTQLPPEIGELVNLEQLDLAYNKLTRLPPEIGKLKNLKSLDLHGNQLTEVSELGALKNLVFLQLDDNPLPQAEKEKIKQLLPNTSINFESNSSKVSPVNTLKPQPTPTIIVNITPILYQNGSLVPNIAELLEGFPDNQKSLIESHRCEGVWKDGLCMNANCSDADLMDVFTKGVAIYNEVYNEKAEVSYDYCLNEKQVVEGFCQAPTDGTNNFLFGTKPFDCPNGCVEGTCKR